MNKANVVMNHDVFISYSSKNKQVADAVVHYLEANKIRCWVAPRDIPPGSEYGDVIVEAIRTSHVFVLLFSGFSIVSPWVKSETNRAVAYGKVIIPFKMDEAMLDGAMEFYLSDRHWIDAFPKPEKHFLKLLRALWNFLADETTDEKSHGFEAGKKVSGLAVQPEHEIPRIELSANSLNYDAPSNLSSKNCFSNVTYEMVRSAFDGGNDFYFCLLSNAATVQQKKIAGIYRAIMDIPRETRIYAYWNDNTYVWQCNVKCGFVLGDMGIWIQSRDAVSSAFFSWNQIVGIQVVFGGIFTGGMLRINTESRNNMFGWHEFKFTSFDEKNVAFLKGAFDRLRRN